MIHYHQEVRAGNQNFLRRRPRFSRRVRIEMVPDGGEVKTVRRRTRLSIWVRIEMVAKIGIKGH